MNLFLVLSSAAIAQGGQYRGPGDPVPPDPLPAPAKEDREPPVLLDAPIPNFDLRDWDFWWEFNKDRYLARDSSRASTLPLGPFVAEALARVLDATKESSLSAACLIALAKTGERERLERLLPRFLASPEPRISEAALLAHGIAGLERSVPDLVEIFRGTERGLALVGGKGGASVRKQAFAGYALGLIAHSHRDSAVKQRVFEAARRTLEDFAIEGPLDLALAASGVLGLLAPDLGSPEGAALAVEAGRCLIDLLEDGKNRILVRAQAPTAVALLLGRDPGLVAGGGPAGEGRIESPVSQVSHLRSRAIMRCVQALEDRDEHAFVVQSCVLALGRMARRGDLEVFRALGRTAFGHLAGDDQAGRFADISIGSIGGEDARTFLIARLEWQARYREKPWVALGLGLLEAERRGAGGEPDPAVAKALAKALVKMRNPAWKAGIAVAFGLAGCREAGPRLLKEIGKSKDPYLLGYIAVPLGLMNYREGAEALDSLFDRSLRIPDLRMHVALGLGLMGDEAAGKRLVQALREGGRTVSVDASLALGLGLLRDPATVEPLVEMLLDQALSARQRAFAAAALGRICDRADLPWNSRIGLGLNYRALVRTLSGEGAGILDLL